MNNKDDLKKRLEEAREASARELERMKHERRERDEYTDKDCRVCSGVIVQRFRFKKIERTHCSHEKIGKHTVWPDTLERKAGPHAVAAGYHCSKCGIEYYKLPE